MKIHESSVQEVKKISLGYSIYNRVNFTDIQEAWKFGLWCEMKKMETNISYQDNFYCVLVDGFCNKTVWHLYQQENKE